MFPAKGARSKTSCYVLMFDIELIGVCCHIAAVRRLLDPCETVLWDWKAAKILWVGTVSVGP